MRKFAKVFILFCVMFFSLVITFEYAQSADSKPVTVVNGVDNPVPVLISYGNRKKKVISAFLLYQDALENDVIMGVPNDKTFILTDIVYCYLGNDGVYFLYENDNVKLRGYYQYELSGDFTHTIHFNSGIPFSPGSEVKYGGKDGSYITISGYLIDN